MYVSAKKISFILYIISFLLPVFKGNSIFGFQAFYYALIGYGGPTILIVWFANITYFFTLILSNSKKPYQFALSLITIFLALCVFAYDSINVTASDVRSEQILWFGYYCWLLSFVILFSRSFVQLFMIKKEATKH